MDTADPADNIDAASARFVPTILEASKQSKGASDHSETPDVAKPQTRSPAGAGDTRRL